MKEEKREEKSVPKDALESTLANMFKTKKEDDLKSVSNMSKASKNVIDMTVNELLSLRMPMPRSNSKVDKESESER